MRKNHTTTEELVNLLNGTTGLRGIKNRMINEATYYYVDKIKKRLGIAMDFQPFQCPNVISWIEKYDKNFKKHIANPYICKTKFNKET